MSDLNHVIGHSILITSFVFVMMLVTDYANVLTRGKMEKSVKGGRGRQYAIASFLGAAPGCLGAFMNVSFYIHGLLGFGAIVGGMIATSGDEAFVMLSLFPEKAILLFVILFVLGIVGAWVSDKAASWIGIVPCRECRLQEVHFEEDCHCFEPSVLKHLSKLCLLRYAISLCLLVTIVAVAVGHVGPERWNWIRITLTLLMAVSVFIILTVPDHYLKEHIWKHIVREHLWRVFLWTFSALLFISIGLRYWNLEASVRSNMAWVFVVCALVGIIPESGPHMVFVMMFANGMVPFSILLTSSIVQDGHGMLPLLSYSLKDVLMIKIFNLLFAVAVGLPLLLIGW